jgi:hypothetical protein
VISPVGTEKSWPLGTQAAPVCEVGVFPLDRTDDGFTPEIVSVVVVSAFRRT